MLKILASSLIAAATGLLLATNISSAAIFDYADIADNPPGELGGQPLVHSDGGITVEARGYLSGSPAAAYLDSGSAGMGVCSTGLDSGDQCIVPSDDNVTADETLELTFSQMVMITDISFADSVHGTSGLVGDELSLVIDGGIAMLMSLDPADWGSYAGLTGTVFEFSYYDEQFYLGSISVTAVPLPPAILLFGAALFGLGWLGRRHRRNMTR